VNDLDNVLYEISNESDDSSKEWQYHLIKFIHDYEARKPKQHPVGMTALWSANAESNQALAASPAEWISPHTDAWGGVHNVPAADGTKVSLLDSDHWFVFELCNNQALGREWVWKSFLRGHNPILMEHLPPLSVVLNELPLTPDDPGYVASRRAMGQTRRLAERMNLAAMTPHPELASTRYCLANPGKEYLVYQPKDGGPKYDLNRCNEAYFQRLRARVKAAGDRGIYVAVMFFAGDNVEYRGGNPNWPLHPYHRDNNINGINGDPNGDGQGLERYRLDIPAITPFQERYIKKVVDTLGDLDNVLPGSLEFAYHITRLVKEYESSSKLKRHPVGISTFANAKPPMRAFADGPADWITPDASSGDYMNNPPAADGKKVIVSDTDHLWGVGGDSDWVWKTFTRGLHPIYMDALDADATRERARRAMGQTRRFAERMNLAAMTPQNGLASTGYCLAAPGKEYLVYQPKSGDAFSVELKVGTYRYEWFNPAKGVAAGSGRITPAGGPQQVKPPFEGDAVLYLKVANVPEQSD